MITIRPFAALRPIAKLAGKIASPPYDILDTDEARRIIDRNEHSFLRIVKPEATLPAGIDQYSPAVYKRGKENLDEFVAKGWLVQDEKPYLYAYRQIMGTHSQMGLVASASTLDYEENRIKKHEFTRHEKEMDRIAHIEALSAQAGPVFLTYKAKDVIDEAMERVTRSEPLYDFTDDTNVRHTFWRIDSQEESETIRNAFRNMDCLYVADGHHRSASATIIAAKRRSESGSHSGDEEYNGFLTVIFPHNQMQIMAYNRVLRHLPDDNPDTLTAKLSDRFTICGVQDGEPAHLHDIRMYTGGKWFRLVPKPESYDENDPVGRLDAQILQQNALAPIFGIEDPRKSKEIAFVGGIKGTEELVKLVDEGEFKSAFSLYPVTIEQLMSIADAGLVMPPKSTWFEPKLKSGLAVHLI